MATTAVVALGVHPVRVWAQSAGGAAPTPPDSEVVVTATRVERKGFVAPTPTTVLNQTDLLVGGRTNLEDVLNDLPAATPVYTPSSTSASVIAGASIPELRDLGIQRTLVLIDGARPVATETSAGTIGFDLNMIPLALVKRVDVVTGGASASWGSDAVAGVINIVMDDAFQGFKGDVQYGGSTQGIGGDEWKVDLAAGTTLLDGRAHIMAGFGYDFRAGIYPKDATAAGEAGLIPNPAYTATNGQSQQIFVQNLRYSDASSGGVITSGPLKGTDFGPGGSIGQFQYGQDAGATFMSGGDATAFNPAATDSLEVPLQRQNFYTRGSYEVNDKLTLTADLLLGHSLTNINVYPFYSLGTTTISVNNAFLPLQIKNELLADHLTSFTLGRVDNDFGDMTNRVEAYTEQLKVGAHGSLNAIWSWDSFASFAGTERSVNWGNEPIAANLANSINAVVSPTTGQPVCAVALTNPSTSCVPVDLFGPGSVSSAAKAYILGTSTLNMALQQVEVAANVRGEPFSLWAGPVSIAAGFEFRNESVSAHTDPLTAAGAFSFFNVGTLSDGSYSVGEGYLETVVPLVRKFPLIQALDFDGGVRVSDYSTTGAIPSWKLGLTDQVTDELRLRGTYSNDIRAPDLAELFIKRSTGIGSVRDPATNQVDVVTSYGGGNVNLQPETAATYTFGFIYQPSWLRGLSLSVDYYNIDISNAITVVAAQTIVNECYDGDTAICSQVVRTNGVITSVSATYTNIAWYKASGFDFEADYSTSLASLKLPGSIEARILATDINTLKENTGSSIENLAGDTTYGSPRVRGTASLAYKLDPFEVTARLRYIEGGAFSKLSTVNSSVPDATYGDIGVQYKIPHHENYVFYADVDNIANALNARQMYYYDVIGRVFDVGLRVRF